jgi:hypothetical protein
MPGASGNQYLWLIGAALGSPVPPLLEGTAPTPLALPDPLHRPPARAGTESLRGRPPLSGEPLIAAGAIATVIEKNGEGLPSRPPQAPLAVRLAGGFAPARGSAGSARCVSVCPLSSPGISAGLSSATTSALPAGTPGCSSVVAPAAGETAARILSTDRGGFAAGALAADDIRHVPNGPVGVYNSRQGPWEVRLPEAPAPERNPLLSGATAGIRFSVSSTLYRICPHAG